MCRKFCEASRLLLSAASSLYIIRGIQDVTRFAVPCTAALLLICVDRNKVVAVPSGAPTLLYRDLAKVPLSLVSQIFLGKGRRRVIIYFVMHTITFSQRLVIDIVAVHTEYWEVPSRSYGF